ncbi:hypothetical protein BDQ94DRAFT_169054 [Aspergillus welwitschiae]|uniref:Uncharacterized protein n=1 Tax=Aspergillus welwitschiae TaxID=1341132 RepID=A0A3F3Q6I1_9EURO|nr:hypothetical protein BDQ94DRAFT_169054 [Aspergillus welwitschiae]RDH34735.1 hypothetical protein BDQ94DRAFT_169054 [Aspergillus welwitschiae]
MADQPPMGRDFIDAKNVDPVDHNDQTDPEDSASQPRFPGPGSSTTAPDVLESEKQENEKAQRRGWD